VKRALVLAGALVVAGALAAWALDTVKSPDAQYQP
jgi:hypothetical protein